LVVTASEATLQAMRRRGVGIAGIKNKNVASEKFKAKGEELAEDQLAQMSKQLAAFQTNLEEFAAKHKGLSGGSGLLPE